MSWAAINSLKMIISIIAYVLIILGAGYLFFPKVVEELNSLVNKTLLNTDKYFFSYRVATGVLFIFVAFVLLFLVNLK